MNTTDTATATAETEQPEKQQEQAYETLRDGIVEFTYLPGQRLSAKEIRKQMGLGRTPVREAIVRLQQDGLVTTKPKSGSYVSLINLKNAECAHFLRITIERAVAIDAAAQITDSELEEMAGSIQAQEQSLTAHDQRNFLEADNAMHQAVFAAAGRLTEWDWLTRTSVDLNRFRWLHVKARSVGWTSILKEHQDYYQALRAHQPLNAAYIIEHHLHVMLDEKEEVLKVFPQYFALEESQA